MYIYIIYMYLCTCTYTHVHLYDEKLTNCYNLSLWEGVRGSSPVQGLATVTAILDFTIQVSFLLPLFYSLPSSLSPLPLFPFFFFILFAYTTKTAPVSPLNQCHIDFRFHDSSLSPSPFPLLTHLVTVHTVALISLTNMTCATWNKYVHLKEQPKNIWPLSLMWWSWIMQSVSTWLMGPNPIPWACGLVNHLLTVFLYDYSPSRQNSYQTWVNSLAETVRVWSQGRQMNMSWCNKCFHRNQITSWIPPVTLGMLKESKKIKTPWH